MPKEGPSSRKYGHFYCEAAEITDVNRKTWTCTVATKHSAKTFSDVQWGAPYHHNTGGEGIHYMPEIGAHCYLALPVDHTPPFIMAFVAPPSVQTKAGAAPAAAEEGAEAPPADVSYQSNRPDLSPGDIAFTTRDENFLILRRGGVVQLGATPMAQRVIVPVRNFVHDFAENYELATPGGDVLWTVDRPELDPAGKPACSWTFHMQEFSTDKKATVRVRHLPLAAAGAKKAAWEVSVAQNGIDRTSGAVSSATYTLMVLTSGEFSEVIGANRTIEVKGDDTLKVGGKQTTTVTGDSKLSAKNITSEASGTNGVLGKVVKLADANAIEPGLLGNAMLQWLPTVQVIGPPGAGVISPASIAAFQKVLSKMVFLK